MAETIWQFVHVVEPSAVSDDPETLWKRFLREKGVKYDARKHFNGSEVPQFLEARFGEAGIPYGRCLFRTQNQCYSGLEGTEVKGERWSTALAYVGASTLRTIITREPRSYEDTFKILGIQPHLTDEVQSKDLGKRLKRLCAPHNGGMWPNGRVVGYKEDGPDTWIFFRLPGINRTLTHIIRRPSGRWAEEITAGLLLMDVRLASELLHRHVSEGEAFQVTGIHPRGFEKGHAVARRLKADLISYDTKVTVSSTGERYCFGILNVLHPSRGAFTDIQATINLGLFKAQNGRFYQNLEGEFFQSLMKMLRNPDLFEADLNKTLRCERESGDFIAPVNFALASAHYHGLPIAKLPALVERWIRTKVNSKWNMNANAFRVPLGEHGQRLYACPDLTVFDELGMVDVKKTCLEPGQVFANGFVGEAVLGRNPMGNPNRCSLVKCVFKQALAALDLGIVVFLHPSDIEGDMQDEQEDFDMDDLMWLLIDKDVVDHVRNWHVDYPKLALEERKTPKPKYDIPEPVQYTTGLVDRTLSDMRTCRVSIGQVVNAVEEDIFQTVYRQEMIDGLLDPKLNDTHKAQPKVAEKMRNYPKFLMALLGCNSGVIIDRINKTGEFVGWVRAILFGDPDSTKPNESLDATIPAIPGWMTYSSRRNPLGDRRSPILKERDIPVVTTHMDMVREELLKEKAYFEEVDVRSFIWKNSFIPKDEFVLFPTHPQAVDVAGEIRDCYLSVLRAERKKLVAQGIKEPQLTIDAYKPAQEAAAAYANSHPLGRDAWIELVRIIYSRASATVRTRPSPVDPTQNQIDRFGDGILWGKDTAPLTISAFKRVGLTIQHKSIAWANRQARSQYGHLRFRVMVKDNVARPDGTSDNPGNILGTVEAPDGAYDCFMGRVRIPVPGDLSGTGQVLVLTLVNGWDNKMKSGKATQADLDTWKGKEGQKVILKPTTFDRGGVAEPAVAVYLEGSQDQFGWVSKLQIGLVPEEMKGTLFSHKSPFMLSCVLTA